jgi:hypothetical protein
MNTIHVVCAIVGALFIYIDFRRCRHEYKIANLSTKSREFFTDGNDPTDMSTTTITENSIVQECKHCGKLKITKRWS